MANLSTSSPTYFYLHGFASGPRSFKAQYLRDRFTENDLTLHTPDLNQGGFFHLTLSRQLLQVQTEFPSAPIILIGSSFGGLTAAWLAEKQIQVQKLVLLAPSFGFLSHWLPSLPSEQLQLWKTEGSMPIYHYAEGRPLPLSYQFVTDAAQYLDQQLQRPIPTLILHGIQDEVIPIQASRDYAAQRSWVSLMELESDHSLGDVISTLWEAIQQFLELHDGTGL
jgi:pimeloyl-ACP methyl ester carboxylesterase